MPKNEVLLGRHERDRIIRQLAAKGVSHAKIGAYVGMSRRGVDHALERIAAEARRPPDDSPRPEEW